MDTKFDPLWRMVRKVHENNDHRRFYKATMDELAEVNLYDSRDELEAVVDEARDKHYVSLSRYGGKEWYEFNSRFTDFYAKPA